MKKLFLSILCMLPLLFATPVVSAVNVFGPCSGSAAQNSSVCTDVNSQDTSQNPIIHGIEITISILALLIGIAAVIIIIISGMRFILANGDANSIKTARSGIIYALICIVIAAVAQTIVVFVLDKL
jgi:hypothetical protein